MPNSIFFSIKRLPIFMELYGRCLCGLLKYFKSSHYGPMSKKVNSYRVPWYIYIGQIDAFAETIVWPETIQKPDAAKKCEELCGTNHVCVACCYCLDCSADMWIWCLFAGLVEGSQKWVATLERPQKWVAIILNWSWILAVNKFRCCHFCSMCHCWFTSRPEDILGTAQ